MGQAVASVAFLSTRLVKPRRPDSCEKVVPCDERSRGGFHSSSRTLAPPSAAVTAPDSSSVPPQFGPSCPGALGEPQAARGRGRVALIFRALPWTSGLAWACLDEASGNLWSCQQTLGTAHKATVTLPSFCPRWCTLQGWVRHEQGALI